MELINFLRKCELDHIGNELYLFLPFEYLSKFRALTEDFFDSNDLDGITFTFNDANIPLNPILEFYKIIYSELC